MMDFVVPDKRILLYQVSFVGLQAGICTSWKVVTKSGFGKKGGNVPSYIELICLFKSPVFGFTTVALC